MVAAGGRALVELPVLTLDCQATGPLSAGGALLEIGFAGTRADAPPDAVSEPEEVHRLCPGPEMAIPAAVSRLTGLTSSDLQTGSPPVAVWQSLCAMAERIVGIGRFGRPCPAVIHYARFETPFLHDLHGRYGAGSAFPLQIVCTHRIARRLYPELPRRGLRALAGYFGHAVPEPRRCRPHIAATIAIWRHLVFELVERAGVETLAQLEDWLARTPAATQVRRRYPMPRRQRASLTAVPGVYRMLGAGGRVLYVGKARSLKQRVNSYFQPRRRHPEHILEMLTQARKVEATPTDSALEAALVESDEIKRLAPPYNQALHSRRRCIWYATKDLGSYRSAPDADHRIGPLPSRRAPSAVGWLAEMLAGRPPAPGGIQVPFPEPYPADDCLAAAGEVFRGRHGPQLIAGDPIRALARVGRQLWAETVAAEDDDSLDPNPDHDPADPQDDRPPRETHTPERLADRLEAAVVHTARMVRRARWMGILADASLVWDSPRRRRATVLVFKRGQVERRL